MGKYLIFSLGEKRFAINVQKVHLVVPAVNITSVPEAPGLFKGIVNMHGEILPIYDIRRRIGMPTKKPGIDDYLLILNIQERKVGIFTGKNMIVASENDEDLVNANEILNSMPEYVESVIKYKEELVLVYDMDKFLSLDDLQTIDALIEDSKTIAEL